MDQTGGDGITGIPGTACVVQQTEGEGTDYKTYT